MTDNTTEAEGEERSVHVGDDILFSLLAGRLPLAYPDMMTRVSYEVGVGVIHIGTVWVLGTLEDGTKALELEDGTLVAIDDIDLDTIVITALGDPDEEEVES